MSQEVKVTIEWDANTAGLHPDSMTVHIAGKADPNEIIGAVAKAMSGKEKPENSKCEDDEFIHIRPEGGEMIVKCPVKKHSFPIYRTTVDWIENYTNRTDYKI